MRLIRQRLRGQHAEVPIKIERVGDGWIAIADIGSEVTREAYRTRR